MPYLNTVLHNSNFYLFFLKTNEKLLVKCFVYKIIYSLLAYNFNKEIYQMFCFFNAVNLITFKSIKFLVV